MSAPKRPPGVRDKHRRAGTVSVRRRDGIGDETDAYLLGREIGEACLADDPTYVPPVDPLAHPDEVTLTAFVQGQWDALSET